MWQRDGAVTGTPGSGAAQGARWRGWLACGLLAVWVIALSWVLAGVVRLAPYDTLGEYRGLAEIVRLELAFTPARAERLLAAWGKGQMPDSSPIIKRLNTDLAWDWGMILAYSAFGWATFQALARWLDGAAVGWRRFAWLPVAAGLADAAENGGLVWLLNLEHLSDVPAHVVAVLVGLTGFFAAVKFALLILTLIAAVAVLVFCLWARRWQLEHGGGERPPWLIDLPQVIARERVYLNSRRRRAGLPAGEDPPPVGLALSGGGIRSATLSLGVLQGLSGPGLWPRIDYLSTVSGGGYAGSALSSLLSCKTLSAGQAPDDPQQFRFDHGDTPHFSGVGRGHRRAGLRTEPPDRLQHPVPALFLPRPSERGVSGHGGAALGQCSIREPRGQAGPGGDASPGPARTPGARDRRGGRAAGGARARGWLPLSPRSIPRSGARPSSPSPSPPRCSTSAWVNGWRTRATRTAGTAGAGRSGSSGPGTCCWRPWARATPGAAWSTSPTAATPATTWGWCRSFSGAVASSSRSMPSRTRSTASAP